MKARKLPNPRESAYAKPVLQRPAVKLLEQILSEPLTIRLIQDRFVMCNATKAWRNLFNVEGSVSKEQLEVHPECWYHAHREHQSVREVFAYHKQLGLPGECVYQIEAGDVYFSALMLTLWASSVLPDYKAALQEVIDGQEN